MRIYEQDRHEEQDAKIQIEEIRVVVEKIRYKQRDYQEEEPKIEKGTEMGLKIMKIEEKKLLDLE